MNDSLPSAAAITRRPPCPPRRDGDRGRERVYGFLRRCGTRYAPPASPAAVATAPRRRRQEGFRSGFSGANRSCIVDISATLPSSKHHTAKYGPLAAGRPPGIPYGLARVPRQTRRVTILSPAENISAICIERSGKPAGRSCNLRLGPVRPTMTSLVWAFSLTMSSASPVFPARPSANHRRPCSWNARHRLARPRLSAGGNFPEAGRRPIRPA